jgi:hypothetical protein
MSDLRAEVVARLGRRVQRVTEISPGRYALELSLEEPPERVLSDLVGTGATLVSLNPVRDTLEDFFVRRVAEVGEGARAEERLRPERGAKAPSESERGWGPASPEKRDHAGH